MYNPTHQELIEMGFSPQEWNGNIYGYSFHALSYRASIDMEGNPRDTAWFLSSWYQEWHPRTREDVELVISRYNTE